MDHDNTKRATKPWKKGLLKPRSGKYKNWGVILSFLLLLVGILTADEVECYIKVFVVELCVLLPFILVGEVLKRICHFMEERKYYSTRYNNDSQLILKYFCQFSLTFFIIFLLWIILFCTYLIWNENPYQQWHQYGVFSINLTLIGVFLFNKIINLDSGPLRESLWISNSNGLDYGSGMANSFYHGYLKLVIPKTGTDDPHLEELMKVYESREHVQLACYKLFILIPKSLHCPPSLQDPQSKSIEESKSLFDKLIDVAGVKGRSYKNSIYKIRSTSNRKIFVAAEYATPLKTFREVSRQTGDHAAVYKRHNNEIAFQFYQTLQKLLNDDPTIGPYCELIYYNDIKGTANYGSEIRHDVGEILLDRIKKIKKKSE